VEVWRRLAANYGAVLSLAKAAKDYYLHKLIEVIRSRELLAPVRTASVGGRGSWAGDAARSAGQVPQYDARYPGTPTTYAGWLGAGPAVSAGHVLRR
jgi:hypothetical protein